MRGLMLFVILVNSLSLLDARPLGAFDEKALFSILSRFRVETVDSPSWLLPEELEESRRGDCEDFAIYFLAKVLEWTGEAGEILVCETPDFWTLHAFARVGGVIYDPYRKTRIGSLMELNRKGWEIYKILEIEYVLCELRNGREVW